MYNYVYEKCELCGRKKVTDTHKVCYVCYKKDLDTRLNYERRETRNSSKKA
jgi:hypothetical protein